jgi:glucose-6-phosphate isomerase
MAQVQVDAAALGAAPAADHALAAIVARRAELGFLELPDDRETARACIDYARALDRDIDTVVVLGIGGSSLPARAIHSALAPAYDALAPSGPGLPRRILFADNIDPASFGALLERVDPRRTLWNVVSKSGGTAETCAQLCVVADRLPAAQIVCTTDPASGTLREVARARGWMCFDIPPPVSGRLSALTPVGLLPAALAGLDVVGLLDGARRMRDRVLAPADNPAVRLAAALHHHHVAHGRAMVVTIAYADGLYAMLEWLGQLWCESLGKQGRGSTPIAARGAPDQHAQLQLWADGPDDKVYVFVTVASRGPDVAIPAALHADWQYLAGRGLGELLDVELAATIDSLVARGRPVARIVLPRASAEAVGELALLLEMTSLVAAPLYGVDPAGEPGVEDGKRRAFAALGRT